MTGRTLRNQPSEDMMIRRNPDQSRAWSWRRAPALAGEDLIRSGDPIAEKQAHEHLAASYDRKHELERSGDDRAVLILGDAARDHLADGRHEYARKFASSAGRHDGHMTGGFALVAFPETNGKSGVMTFIVNQDGIILEKNLGPATGRIVRRMAALHPDRSWNILSR